jgi:hypothetical protein
MTPVQSMKRWLRGGLLTLAAMMFFAARVLDTGVVLTVVIGYLIYAATHFTFHVTHFAGFGVRDALAVGTGLGIEVVLALLLLYVGWLVRRHEAAALPPR